MAEDVLVIGAGPAGIACAYTLKKAGLSYKVVDRSNIIASTWASLYPSLRLNTTRFFSHMPGKRFPWRWGIFPTGRQYHRYLTEFVSEHNLNIELGVHVKKAYPEGDGWRVDMIDSAGGHVSEWYPAIISATGRFNAPIMPVFPGQERFKGKIIHACDYVGPEPFIDKRVMVVGNGPSGLDIATELADYAAVPVLLSQRTGVVLKPRYPLGLPKHLWMIFAERLPFNWGEKLLQFVESQVYRDAGESGIRVPPPDQMSTAAGGARGRELINAAKVGKIKSVDCPARFYEYEVELLDGICVQVDAVIMGTGYRPVLYQYLDIEDKVEKNIYDWPKRINEPDDVYWQGDREVIGFPGLYLVGIYYQGKGAMYNFNVEAEAAVEEIKRRLAQIKRVPSDPVTDQH